MVRILVVEDERKLRANLCAGLREEGFEVAEAADGNEGARLAGEGFDLVLLDLLLPGRDGLEVVAGLRRNGLATPVLILTARDGVGDRVAGLDAGADDYLLKPFAFEELLARVRALLRRSSAAGPAVLKTGELEMNLMSRRVTLGGTAVELSVREAELLEYFLRHSGETLSRAAIARDVWRDDGPVLTNVIDVYVQYLRRKAVPPGGGLRIETIRGVGYRLEATE